MSRRVRPHLPSSTFHLTTRLHRSEALFEPELRTALVGIIRDQLAFSDIELLAYAIMPNHLHIVVRQGQQPLAAFMQPILRRAALLVQRQYDRIGHVFERRYRHTACGDPEHLRNSVVYLHLNAVRAGLCATPDDYAWTSHGAWTGNATACDGAADPVALDRALHLFASGPARSRVELIADYLAFMNWRIRFDQCAAEAEQTGQQLLVVPTRPPVEHGDLAWLRGMTPRPPYVPKPAEELAPQLTGASPRLDLADIARAVLAESGTGIDLRTVRSRWGGPTHHRLRDAIILRASAAGYSGVQIAAYLRISPSAVSRSLVRDRRKLLDRRG